MCGCRYGVNVLFNIHQYGYPRSHSHSHSHLHPHRFWLVDIVTGLVVFEQLMTSCNDRTIVWIGARKLTVLPLGLVADKTFEIGTEFTSLTYFKYNIKYFI